MGVEPLALSSDMLTATTSSRVGGIRSLREARGLTQVDLAQLAGCSVAYLRLLEAGCIPRRSRVLPDVLRALENSEATRDTGGSAKSDHGAQDAGY